MRAGSCNNFMKLGAFIFASACAWYLGSLLAYVVPEESLISTYDSLQNIAERPKIKAPSPKRLKCDHWTSCSPETYAYRLRSGGGRNNYPKICFEDSLLMSDKARNVGRGINIAIVNYDTGNVFATETFDMWEGEFSAPMTRFIRKAPPRSLFLMVSHDDGSSRLKEDGKKAIAELGSKQIWNLKFRSNWVFIGAKGFKLPEDIEKEKINHSEKSKDRYNGWPAEIQIEGCIPKNMTS